MKGKKKVIRITCKGASWLKPEQFEAFQGDSKELKEENYQKIRKAITDGGFSFPVFVWRDRGTNYIVDGHQRLTAVGRMLEEGMVLEGGKLPVDWIEARNKKEAKEKLLWAMSQYGKYTDKSLLEYIGDAGLDLTRLNLTVDIPAFDLEKILEGKDRKTEKPEVPFTEELLEEHNYVVLYFDNQVDWLQALSILKLKRVKALDSKEGFEKMGVGRVMKGTEAIERIRESVAGEK